jgi:flagella basal body P-ring formation protein FlgA
MKNRRSTFSFPSSRARRGRSLFGFAVGVLVTVALSTAMRPARAADDMNTAALGAAVADQVRELALLATQQSAAQVGQSAAGAVADGRPAPRFGVVVGTLDPRLKLAPCQRIEPYLPPGIRLWGKARIGLRCTQGVRPWNVYLPITIKVYGRAVVASVPLPAGTIVREGDLQIDEIDLAEDNSPAITSGEFAVGRVLARPLAAGQGVRQADIKPRQWFAAGDMVKVVAVGVGFSVGGAGTALTPGIEGQPARVRTDSGQVISGMPVGTRQLEVSL